MTIQAVILAGGEGQRIHPLGINKPKSMFEIMGKPLIQFVIENLRSAEIRDIIVVTGPDQERIRNYLGDGNGLDVKIRYTVQEQALGQANAIQTAEQMIEDPFFVLNANDVFEQSLLFSMLEKAQTDNAGLVLAGRQVNDPWRFGVMRLENGKLTGVVEKPSKGQEPSQTIVVGVYYFSPEIFQYIHHTPHAESDDQLERAYQKMIDDGKASHITYEGVFESYKYPWDLLSIANILLRQGITEQYISPSARISDRAIIDGKVIIEDNVRIFENAIIRGPAFIGSGTIIGNNTLIRGSCSFGSGCMVGFGSEINHSVFGKNVWTHTAYIGDSIVSDNCSFGARTTTANWRFDDENIQVRIKDERIDSGLNKLGVIMAEGCRTGSNSVLYPGTKVGPNSIVGPGVCLQEDLPSNTIALSEKSGYRIRENKLSLADKELKLSG